MKRIIALCTIAALAAAVLLLSCGGGGGGGGGGLFLPHKSSAKAITAYSFTSPAATGVIDEGAKTIEVTVPASSGATQKE